MQPDIQRADARLRLISGVVLVFATLIAIVGVIAFHRWMSQQAATLPTALLIAQLRRWIGFALLACGLCLLLLAGYAARVARQVIEQRRWPRAGARVLRDTPIRRDAAALRFGRLLNLAAIVLLALALGAGALSWRMSLLGS